MEGISIIMPCEKGRLSLLFKTLKKYIELDIPDFVEFVIPTRTLKYKDISKNWDLNIRLVPYQHDGEYFNPSKALNLGIKYSYYDNVIISCPEVKPITNVLQQMADLERGNYVCQVYDTDFNNNRTISLINHNYRSDTPSMYFFAMFKKEDIIKINGWDEDFMQGYAYEDDNFGLRFVNAGLSFNVKDEIQAEHQYHLRGTLNTKGAEMNRQLNDNKKHDKVCKNGLIKNE